MAEQRAGFGPDWVSVRNSSKKEQTERELIQDLLGPAPKSPMEEDKSRLEDGRDKSSAPGLSPLHLLLLEELPASPLRGCWSCRLHDTEFAALKVQPKHSGRARSAFPAAWERRESTGSDSFSWKKHGYCLESSEEAPRRNKKKKKSAITAPLAEMRAWPKKSHSQRIQGFPKCTFSTSLLRRLKMMGLRRGGEDHAGHIDERGAIRSAGG